MQIALTKTIESIPSEAKTKPINVGRVAAPNSCAVAAKGTLRLVGSASSTKPVKAGVVIIQMTPTETTNIHPVMPLVWMLNITPTTTSKTIVIAIKRVPARPYWLKNIAAKAPAICPTIDAVNIGAISPDGTPRSSSQSPR
ncbi:MAG: hypothetical protein ABJX46_06690 [Erythrobacter sp.]